MVVVGAQYFAAFGGPIVAGREFTEAEERSPDAEPVAIIDQALARRLFSGENPIGESLRLRDEFVRVVGVAAEVRDVVGQSLVARIYVPFGRHYQGEMTLHARTAAGAETAMFAPVREAIRGVDARLPVFSLQTMASHRALAPSMSTRRLAVRIFAAFGVIAPALATAGVYGLRACLVARRTREIGIRLALGAGRRRMIRQLLGEGFAIAVAGVTAGIVLAVGLVQVLRRSGMLPGSAGNMGLIDPRVFTLAPLLLGAMVAAASCLPVRKALGIDPAAVLRSD